MADDGIELQAAILALSLVGDLSMGQPLGQSRRSASLARRLARACHGAGEHVEVAGQVALLRWSGCTANAEGFARLLGDDVGGRNAMLSQTLDSAGRRAMRRTTPLAVVHCEVAGEVAHSLGLGAAVELGLRNVFEQFDGQGRPFGLRHPEVPEVVYQVMLTGDLEIHARVHGLPAALDWIAAQADRRYPAGLVAELARHAADWLALAEEPEDQAPAGGAQVPLTLVADVIDLKLPWLAGYSRRAAELVRQAGRLWQLDQTAVEQAARAALIHGIGRAAVPNRIWNVPGAPLAGDFEQIRLVPYWTARACSRISALAAPGRLAASAYERLDGSGYFRELAGEALSSEQRLLAAALAWQALRSERPWRPAFDEREAQRVLLDEAGQGCFDAQACRSVIAAARGEESVAPCRGGNGLLSEREAQILKCISLGASNKEAARQLGISPSTVRTHVESVFRKLQCTTRAAATLKALTLGLI